MDDIKKRFEEASDAFGYFLELLENLPKDSLETILEESINDENSQNLKVYYPPHESIPDYCHYRRGEDFDANLIPIDKREEVEIQCPNCAMLFTLQDL